MLFRPNVSNAKFPPSHLSCYTILQQQRCLYLIQAAKEDYQRQQRRARPWLVHLDYASFFIATRKRWKPPFMGTGKYIDYISLFFSFRIQASRHFSKRVMSAYNDIYKPLRKVVDINRGEFLSFFVCSIPRWKPLQLASSKDSMFRSTTLLTCASLHIIKVMDGYRGREIMKFAW